MATIAELVTKFIADTSNFTKGVNQVKKGTNAFGKGIVGADTKTKGLNLSMLKTVAGMAGLAIGIRAVVRVTKEVIKIFAEFEQSMAKVRSITKATDLEFLALQQAAKSAGETTRFTANQAADALFFLASAGLSATESAEALAGVLLLAGATGSDLGTTAETVTAIISQFSLETEEAARVANVFAAANANSQATMEKLRGAFQQVGPVAAGLNITLEETTGALQILFNAGFRGERAGRALKSALADLATESSLANRKLQQLGVSFEEVNPETVGLIGSIRALEEAGIGTSQALDIFGKVAGPQLSILIREGAGAIEQYTEAVTDTNEAAEQYAIQNDTLKGDLDILKSVTQAVAIEFGEGFAPVIRDTIKAITGLIRFAKPLIEVLADLGGIGLRITFALFNALAIAIGKVGDGLSRLLDIFEEWRVTLKKNIEDNVFLQEALDKVRTAFRRLGRETEDGTEINEEYATQLNLNTDALIVHLEKLKELTRLQEELNAARDKEIADRIAIRNAAVQALADIEIRARKELEIGLITQEEFNKKLIEGNRDLVNSLLDVDYNGLRGQIGDQIILTSIAQIKLLIAANEDLKDVGDKVLKGVVTLKQERIDSADRERRAAEAKKQSLNEEIDLEDQISKGVEDLKQARIDSQDREQRAAESRKQALEDEKILAVQLKEIYIGLAVSVPGQIASIINAVNSLKQSQTQATIQALDAEAAARVAAGEDEIAVREEIEKKKAQIEFKAALSSWRLQLFSSIATGAQVILNGFLTKPFIPAGIAAGLLATTLAALQIGAIKKAKPVKQFQTGAGGFQVPEGFPDDSFQAGFSSGELLNVQTPSQQAGTDSNITQIIEIALPEGVIYRTVNKGFGNRKIRIPA